MVSAHPLSTRDCYRDDQMYTPQDSSGGNGSRTSSRTLIFECVRLLSTYPQRSHPGRPGQSILQFQRKAAGKDLLLLAQFGKESEPETVVPKVSQEILAEMIGTTRSRVSFMNHFRNWG